MARLLDRYKTEIVPELMKRLGRKNRMAVPRIEKITVSAGVGNARENEARLQEAMRTIGIITGQKPIVTKARVSVSGFKVRKGFPVGAKVTIRGPRMYEFLDRLINTALPRIRDFRGVSPDAFDGRGNYTLGISEQAIFPEITPDDIKQTQGFDITITIRNSSDKESLELLSLLGIPFRR